MAKDKKKVIWALKKIANLIIENLKINKFKRENKQRKL